MKAYLPAVVFALGACVFIAAAAAFYIGAQVLSDASSTTTAPTPIVAPQVASCIPPPAFPGRAAPIWKELKNGGTLPFELPGTGTRFEFTRKGESVSLNTYVKGQLVPVVGDWPVSNLPFGLISVVLDADSTSAHWDVFIWVCPDGIWIAGYLYS